MPKSGWSVTVTTPENENINWSGIHPKPIKQKNRKRNWVGDWTQIFWAYDEMFRSENVPAEISA